MVSIDMYLLCRYVLSKMLNDIILFVTLVITLAILDNVDRSNVNLLLSTQPTLLGLLASVLVALCHRIAHLLGIGGSTVGRYYYSLSDITSIYFMANYIVRQPLLTQIKSNPTLHKSSPHIYSFHIDTTLLARIFFFNYSTSH